MKVISIAAALLAAFAVAACGGDDDGNGSSGDGGGETSEPIRIGAVLSLTGPGASLGVQEREAIELVADQLNKGGGVEGRKIELEFADDKSTPDQAVRSTRSMIQSFEPDAIIGGSISATCLAMKPITEQEQVLQYCLSAAPIEAPAPYYFSAQSPFSRWIGDVPMHWLKEQGVGSVGCIGTNDTSGQLTVELAEQAAKGAGLEFAAQTFSPTDTDVTPQLTKLRDANVESLLVCSTGAAAVTAVQGINQLGFDVPVWITSGSASLPIAELIKGILPEGGAYTAGAKVQVAEELPEDDAQRKQILAFKEAYESRYDKPADIFAATGADAITMVSEAVAGAGADASAEDMAAYMVDKIDYTGVHLVYDFTDEDHRGTDLDGVVERFTPKGGFELEKLYEPSEIPTYAE